MIPLPRKCSATCQGNQADTQTHATSDLPSRSRPRSQRDETALGRGAKQANFYHGGDRVLWLLAARKFLSHQSTAWPQCTRDSSHTESRGLREEVSTSCGRLRALFSRGRCAEFLLSRWRF